MKVEEKRLRFREMHGDGMLVLPNPWDIGGARKLERMGYRALASSSAALAWSLGLEDQEVSLEQVLAHLQELCAATDLPVNADFEYGYADSAAGVHENVLRAIATGVAGLSIEDAVDGAWISCREAVARLRVAREAVDSVDPNIVLVGRCEAFLLGHNDISSVAERLRAYSEAGADCLYAPGVTDRDEIRLLVRAVAPKPLNVLLIDPAMSVDDLRDLGVRRVSVGGLLGRAAWKGFEDAARQLLDAGSLPKGIYPS